LGFEELDYVCGDMRTSLPEGESGARWLWWWRVAGRTRGCSKIDGVADGCGGGVNLLQSVRPSHFCYLRRRDFVSHQLLHELLVFPKVTLQLLVRVGGVDGAAQRALECGLPPCGPPHIRLHLLSHNFAFALIVGDAGWNIEGILHGDGLY
jgi:hypothetical protein